MGSSPKEKLIPRENVSKKDHPVIGVIQLVRKVIPTKLPERKAIPEKEKLLRLEQQTFMQGYIKYQAVEKKEGGVKILLKIMLPPDEEELFELLLNSDEIKSLQSISERIRVALVEEYVFKKIEKEGRGGFGAHDIKRVYEIAQEIFETFSN